MNASWLFLIIPACMWFGFALCALMVAAKDNDVHVNPPPSGMPPAPRPPTELAP